MTCLISGPLVLIACFASILRTGLLQLRNNFLDARQARVPGLKVLSRADGEHLLRDVKEQIAHYILRVCEGQG